MKKLASLLMAGLLAITMIAPVAADSTKVLNGTPVVDGQLDEIYLQSAEQTLQRHDRRLSDLSGAERTPFFFRNRIPEKTS